MAYTLTLTPEERKAFDWVGGRYNAGAVAGALRLECMGPDDEWTQEGDITFNVPEWVAWEIDRLAEEENYAWPRFADSLKSKLVDFCNAIV